jgi:hypothetical protein
MTDLISPRVLAELGLEGFEVTPVTSWRVPASLAQTDEGFVRGSEASADLEQAVLDDWDPEEVALEALEPVQLSFWRPNVQVLVIEPGAAEVFATRPLRPLDDGMYLLEVEPGLPQGLLIETAGQRRLVEVHPGAVQVFDAPSPPVDAVAAPTVETIEPPDLEALLGQEALDPPLMDHARAYASTGSPYAVCAAVGWVSGLWRPAPRSGLEQLLEVEWPQARARRWAAGLGPGAQAAIIAEALDEADRLVLALDDVAQAVAEGAPEASTAARGWLRDRQTLAEVRRVLGPAGEALDASLAALDDATRASAEPFFALEDLLDDDVLSIAAVKDPEAPWVRIAGS